MRLHIGRLTFSSLVSRFSGGGGLVGVKEKPAAAGRGAHRRSTLLSILGFRVGVEVAGGGGAVAWGSPEKKLGKEGPRGMAGAAADRRWGVFSGRVGAVWPVVAGGSGGWRLKMNRRPLISYPTAAKSTDQR